MTKNKHVCNSLQLKIPFKKIKIQGHNSAQHFFTRMVDSIKDIY